jgi:xyloglucan 6-xylosyltransferase
VYGHKGNWFGLNAGVFLIRNCEWSHELLRVWRALGLPEMRADAQHAFNADIPNRPPQLRADDQSALIYVLRSARVETEPRVHLEAAYYLHGYWRYMVWDANTLSSSV